MNDIAKMNKILNKFLPSESEEPNFYLRVHAIFPDVDFFRLKCKLNEAFNTNIQPIDLLECGSKARLWSRIRIRQERDNN